MQGLSHACSLHLLRSLAHRPRGSPPGVGRAGLSVEAGRCRPVICRVHCGRYGDQPKKKPAMRLGGPWPWQGSMVGGQWPKGAQHQTHALQGPPRNTAGFLLIACRHGATRNDIAMVSLKVLSVQLFAVRSSSSRSSAKSASIRSISIRWRALRSTSSG